MIDFNDNRRRNYSLLYKDALFLLDDIAEHLSELPTISDELYRIAAALEKLTEHPAADTDTLKAANEKLDAALDTLNLIAGATNPDAAFSLRRFSDGSGRFLPTDKATPTETPTTDD